MYVWLFVKVEWWCHHRRRTWWCRRHRRRSTALPRHRRCPEHRHHRPAPRCTSPHHLHPARSLRRRRLARTRHRRHPAVSSRHRRRHRARIHRHRRSLCLLLRRSEAGSNFPFVSTQRNCFRCFLVGWFHENKCTIFVNVFFRSDPCRLLFGVSHSSQSEFSYISAVFGILFRKNLVKLVRIIRVGVELSFFDPKTPCSKNHQGWRWDFIFWPIKSCLSLMEKYFARGPC